MPKLTIGIPTFNGAKHIGETIESVLTQLNTLPDGYVQILISDNCSDPALRRAVGKYLDKYPGIVVYHRNDVNLRFDGNINTIFDRASGEYVWLLSDDDILNPGAIAAARPFMERHLDYIHVNWSECYPDLRVRNLKALPLEQDLETVDFSRFISEVRLAPLFVSSNIFRRDKWGKSADVFVGSGWLHYAKLLALAGMKVSLAVIAVPQVKYRGGASAWKKDSCFNIDLGIRLLEILRHYSECFSKPVFRRCFEIAISEMHMQICAARLGRQSIPPGSMEKIGRVVDFGWRYKYFYRSLFVLPLPVIRALYLCFKFTNKSAIFLGKRRFWARLQ